MLEHHMQHTITRQATFRSFDSVPDRPEGRFNWVAGAYAQPVLGRINCYFPVFFVTTIISPNKAVAKLLIPQTSVQEDQAGQFVILVTEDNKVEQRRISLTIIMKASLLLMKDCPSAIPLNRPGRPINKFLQAIRTPLFSVWR